MSRNDKDEKVEGGSGSGLADKVMHKLIPFAGPQAPAPGVVYGQIPVGLKWDAGGPGEDGKYQSPDGHDGDQAFAKKASFGPSFEDAKVLEQQRDLDKSDRQWIGEATNVHDLEKRA